MFNITIDQGISYPGYGRKVVDDLNATYKSFIFHLMDTVEISGSELCYTPMTVYTATQNTDMSLALGFQEHLPNLSSKHCF